MIDEFAITEITRPPKARRRNLRRPSAAALIGLLVGVAYACWPTYVEFRLNLQRWHLDDRGVACQDIQDPERDREGAPGQYPSRRRRYAAFLRYRPTWTRIRLDNVIVGPRDTADLAKAGQISELAFYGCAFEPGAIERLAPLSNLTKIRIIGAKIAPSELRSLAAIPSLETVVLGGVLVDCSALAAVATVKDLKEIVIRRSGLRSADITPLAGMPNLERLSLAFTDVDCEIIPVIRRIPNLRKLDLRSTLVEFQDGRFVRPAFPPGVQTYGLQHFDEPAHEDERNEEHPRKAEPPAPLDFDPMELIDAFPIEVAIEQPIEPSLDEVLAMMQKPSATTPLLSISAHLPSLLPRAPLEKSCWQRTGLVPRSRRWR